MTGASAVLAWSETAHADEVPIVYSRCPRGHGPTTVTGTLVKGGVASSATVTLPMAGELNETLPDTARTTGSFVAPCDLVYRDEKGTEKILYSCIATSTEDNACAALDASVSFDAKTVAFAVFHGKLDRLMGTGNPTIFDPAAENAGDFFRAPLLGYQLATTDAQIVLVEVATGKLTPLPYPPESINFAPTWLSDGRLMFSSARREIYAPMPYFCDNNSARAIQLYTMDVDGRNLELAAPHAAGAELHPMQIVDGRVVSSSWQEFGLLPYRHGNSWGGCGTTTNFFHMYAQRPDGSNAVAVYGQHLSDPKPSEPTAATHVSSHFFGQTSDGRMWTAEYYRGNNLGLGNIVGFELPPEGQEGMNAAEAAATNTSAYRPPGQVRLAEWASPNDLQSGPMPAPPMTIPGYTSPLPFAGKLGHPAGLPGNKLLVTWGVGMCTQATGAYEFLLMKDWQKTYGDTPMCDVGIYRTAELPTTGTNPVPHPSALVPVVNDPAFHEFMAKPVVPYSQIHQVEKPAIIERPEIGNGDVSLEHGTPFGVLGASSILHRETNPGVPLAFESEEWFYRGTDAIDYTNDDLCGVRILAVYPNRKVESYWKSATTLGERVAILGEFPVRKKDGSKDGLDMPDTSFRVRFPADTPYLMQGIDCEGHTLNTDQTWQSLRAGETKTCNGCHVHSAAATKLPYASTRAALDPGNNTAILGNGKIPLMVGKSGADVQKREVDGFSYMIEFDMDIVPILERRCVSCHSGEGAQAGLRLDIPRDFKKVEQNQDDSTYYRLVLDVNQKYVPASLRRHGSHDVSLNKPQVSKYIRTPNSRRSLLFWKAKNQRTDNRTDSSFDDDVDFGANHPTDTTPEELQTLARWIDTGSGWGSDFKLDNLIPTLHLVGVASGQTITALKIGTVDTGDGIDPASLTVCVAPPGGECGPNLATKAEVAGVTTIQLAQPLSDLESEVLATVKDRAGNVREARYTVRYLLALPPPPPPGTTIGANGADGTSGGSNGANDSGGCGCRIGARQAPEFAASLFVALGLLASARRSRKRNA